MKYLVYPRHGVGKVISEENREIFGKIHKMIILQILNSGMKVLIDKENQKQLGLRPIMSKGTAVKVAKILTTPPETDSSSWSRRYRKHLALLSSSDPLEVATVVAELNALRSEKELSFGERKMLDCARELLTLELDLVLNKTV